MRFVVNWKAYSMPTQSKKQANSEEYAYLLSNALYDGYVTVI